MWDSLVKIEARSATEAELGLCHTGDYISLARHDILEGAPELATGDTAVCERSWEAALWAAGSVFCAVDAVFSGRADNAFCVVRPPGHHASAARGMGFCVFNNIALGARYAQKTHNVKRVLIVDWDVHHGNGTQDLFYEDGSVFVFNTHQARWFPEPARRMKPAREPAGARRSTARCLPAPGGRNFSTRLKTGCVPRQTPSVRNSS